MNHIKTHHYELFCFNSLNRFKFAFLLSGLLLTVCPTRATEFIIDGTTRLNTITVPNNGTHHIRFTGAGYQLPGNLTLSNNKSDSLIFERNSPSDSAITANVTLFHFQGQKGTVVFRGLSFKLNTGGAVFDTTLGFNHHLVFDGCQFLGDTASTGKILAWGGDGTSNITLSNNMFTYTGAISLTGAANITLANNMLASTGALSLTGTNIALSNNLLNFSGVLSANATSRLDMKYNTVNKTQFLLDGNFTATCAIQNNYFANPPAKNNLAQGGSQKFISFFRGGSFLSPGSSVINNSRYSNWDGFDFFPPGAAMFSDSSNISIAPSKDSAMAWDWKIAADTIHGAWNGSSPLPNFNFFPTDSTLSFSLPVGKAVFNLNRSNFPRVVSATFGTAAYSTSLPDSVRSWFRSDTTLVITGSAIVQSITMPSRLDGKPMLFAKSDSIFVHGFAGLEGASTFSNGSAMASEFIPTFGGQNTFRGSNISVNALSTDTALLFSTVTRAGRTTIQATGLTPLNKRWRSLQNGGNAFGLKVNINSEGSGPVTFGLSKNGVDAPIKSDSLSWWLGGNTYSTVKDSAGKLWGTAAYASIIQALLIEKLGIGVGMDTIPLLGGALLSQSVGGYHLVVDSTYIPSETDFPTLTHFSRGFSFSWMGRGSGDSLLLQFHKNNAHQKIFTIKDGKSVPQLATADDSDSVTLPILPTDFNKVFFLAALKTDVAIGPGNRNSANANLPTFLQVGNVRLPWGEGAQSGRIRLYNTDGTLVFDATVARDRSVLALKGVERALLFGWWTVQINGMRTRQLPIRLIRMLE